MQRLAITDVSPGAVLGASVFNEVGRSLVKAGVPLTDRLLKLVAARDYCRLVLLADGETLRIEFVPPEAGANVLEALIPSVDYLLKIWRNQTLLRPDDARHVDRRLRRAVGTFVREERFEGTLSLPGPVRRGHAQWFDDAVNAVAVAVYLGRAFALNEATLHRLAHGMLLRDVAMLTFAPEWRDRPGELPPAARAAVREHPMRAYQLLAALEWMDESARLVVLQHHERHDGSGYPAGLSGLHRVQRTRSELLNDDLTLLVSDIAAVADVFTALTVDRAHRPCRPPTEVAGILRAMMGATLNQEVVRLLLESWRPPQEAAAATGSDNTGSDNTASDIAASDIVASD